MTQIDTSTEAVEALADRIEELEANLAKAVEAVRVLKERCQRLDDPRYENTCRDIIDLLQQPSQN